MSLLELLVVLMVAFLLCKPEDLPKIATKIRGAYDFINKTRQEITGYFALDMAGNNISIQDQETEQINFYLEQIIRAGGEYNGEYSLKPIKDYHKELIAQSIATQTKKLSSPERARNRQKK